MPRITIPSRKPLAFGAIPLRYTANTPRTERLEARIAELDLAHRVEIKRLAVLLDTMKQKYFSSRKRKG